nr:hypothetical protein [Microvirga arsenatis]
MAERRSLAANAHRVVERVPVRQKARAGFSAPPRAVLNASTWASAIWPETAGM